MGGGASKRVDDEFNSSDNTQLLPESTNGVGIGVVLHQRQDGGSLFVKSVVPGGPAHKSGLLMRGDIIVAVESSGLLQDAKGKSIEQVRDMIVGDPGTKVKLVVLRKGDAGAWEKKELEFTRNPGDANVAAEYMENQEMETHELDLEQHPSVEELEKAATSKAEIAIATSEEPISVAASEQISGNSSAKDHDEISLNKVPSAATGRGDEPNGKEETVRSSVPPVIFDPGEILDAIFESVDLTIFVRSLLADIHRFAMAEITAIETSKSQDTVISSIVSSPVAALVFPKREAEAESPLSFDETNLSLVLNLISAKPAQMGHGDDEVELERLRRETDAVTKETERLDAYLEIAVRGLRRSTTTEEEEDEQLTALENWQGRPSHSITMASLVSHILTESILEMEKFEQEKFSDAQKMKSEVNVDLDLFQLSSPDLLALLAGDRHSLDFVTTAPLTKKGPRFFTQGHQPVDEEADPHWRRKVNGMILIEIDEIVTSLIDGVHRKLQSLEIARTELDKIFEISWARIRRRKMRSSREVRVCLSARSLELDPEKFELKRLLQGELGGDAAARGVTIVVIDSRSALTQGQEFAIGPLQSSDALSSAEKSDVFIGIVAQTYGPTWPGRIQNAINNHTLNLKHPWFNTMFGKSLLELEIHAATDNWTDPGLKGRRVIIAVKKETADAPAIKTQIPTASGPQITSLSTVGSHMQRFSSSLCEEPKLWTMGRQQRDILLSSHNDDFTFQFDSTSQLLTHIRQEISEAMREWYPLESELESLGDVPVSPVFSAQDTLPPPPGVGWTVDVASGVESKRFSVWGEPPVIRSTHQSLHISRQLALHKPENRSRPIVSIDWTSRQSCIASGTSIGPDDAFIGREDVLTALDAFFESGAGKRRTLRGVIKSEVVLLHGPAGSGKTATLSHWIRNLSSRYGAVSPSLTIVSHLDTATESETIFDILRSLIIQLRRNGFSDAIAPLTDTETPSAFSEFATYVPRLLIVVELSQALKNIRGKEEMSRILTWIPKFHPHLTCVISLSNEFSHCVSLSESSAALFNSNVIDPTRDGTAPDDNLIDDATQYVSTVLPVGELDTRQSFLRAEAVRTGAEVTPAVETKNHPPRELNRQNSRPLLLKRHSSMMDVRDPTANVPPTLSVSHTDLPKKRVSKIRSEGLPPHKQIEEFVKFSSRIPAKIDHASPPHQKVEAKPVVPEPPAPPLSESAALAAVIVRKWKWPSVFLRALPTHCRSKIIRCADPDLLRAENLQKEISKLVSSGSCFFLVCRSSNVCAFCPLKIGLGTRPLWLACLGRGLAYLNHCVSDLSSSVMTTQILFSKLLAKWETLLNEHALIVGGGVWGRGPEYGLMLRDTTEFSIALVPRHSAGVGKFILSSVLCHLALSRLGLLRGEIETLCSIPSITLSFIESLITPLVRPYRGMLFIASEEFVSAVRLRYLAKSVGGSTTTRLNLAAFFSRNDTPLIRKALELPHHQLRLSSWPFLRDTLGDLHLVNFLMENEEGVQDLLTYWCRSPMQNSLRLTDHDFSMAAFYRDRVARLLLSDETPTKKMRYGLRVVSLLVRAGRPGDAASILRHLITSLASAFETERERGAALLELATLLRLNGHQEESVEICGEARKVLGASGDDGALAIGGELLMGVLKREDRDFSASVECVQRAVWLQEILLMKFLLGRDSSGEQRVRTLVTLSKAQGRLGKWRESLQNLEEALSLSNAIHGAESASSALILCEIGTVTVDSAGKPRAALHFLEKSFQILNQVCGSFHRDTHLARSQLDRCLSLLGDTKLTLQSTSHALPRTHIFPM